MIDFPNTPTVNQIFTSGGLSWQWDGVKWVPYSGTVGPYLPLAGGTMTGLLTLSGAPTANLHAATKLYVDTADALKLPLTGGTLTGNLAVYAASPILYINATTAGNQAQILFEDAGTPKWTLAKNTDNSFYIYNNAAPAFALIIDTAGAINFSHGDTYLGGYRFAVVNGVYTNFYDHSGNLAILIGSGSDPSNYYRNTSHFFGSVGGSTPFIALAAAGMYMSTHIYPNSTNLYSCGNATNAWYQVQAFNFLNPSDRKDKTDIQDLPRCLDLLRALKPQRFRWTNGPDEDRDKTHWGFIAQDVGAVFAGLDFGGHQIHPPDEEHPEGGESIAYNELTAVLWAAVSELADEVRELRSRGVTEDPPA
jgi:hypothetical protein